MIHSQASLKVLKMNLTQFMAWLGDKQQISLPYPFLAVLRTWKEETICTHTQFNISRSFGWFLIFIKKYFLRILQPRNKQSAQFH